MTGQKTLRNRRAKEKKNRGPGLDGTPPSKLLTPADDPSSRDIPSHREPTSKPEELLGAARAATDREAWAAAVWRAFEARRAELLGQGLLTEKEAEGGAWSWLARALDRGPDPPPWRPR